MKYPRCGAVVKQKAFHIHLFLTFIEKEIPMQTRNLFFVAIISSLTTILLLVAIFAVVSPTLANQASQMGVLDPTATPNPQPDGSQLIDPGDSSQANAIPSPEDVSQAAAGTQYLHISGSGFTPMYSDTDATYYSGGCTYSAGSSSTHAFFNYPIALPYNSVINSVRFYYYDASATDMTLRIRQMNDGDDWSDVATITSTGDAGLSYRSVSGLTYLVDYTNYSYVVQVQDAYGSTMRLCGVRIGYTPPGIFGVALPSLSKP
jgi:hypothetical protein